MADAESDGASQRGGLPARAGESSDAPGRDSAGSNWATYFYDPDGHTNELYYGIEQIGWDGKSKPAEYRRPVAEKVRLPVKSEFEEIQESLATTGVPISAGYRPVESPSEYEVDGIFLPRPFKIVKHGPVNIFVSDVVRSRDFYVEMLGFEVTEEVVYRGERCVFLRCNTEHHSLGLLPLSLREPLGLSAHTTCASFGIQVANYRQLREAVVFLRSQGVRVRRIACRRSCIPGIDYAAYASIPKDTALSCTTTWSRWAGTAAPGRSPNVASSIPMRGPMPSSR